MENFDDEFGDLSGYKILSFEEVSKDFEGNKNPLQGIAKQSFEARSNQYALQSPLGEKSLFYKKTISDFVYNINTNPLWKYRIENSTKGNELIDNYTKYDETIDSSKGKYDEETDFIIYIEEQNNINGFNVDLNSVCLIKMSQAMLNEYFTIIKKNSTSNILEEWSSIIIAQQKNVNNLKFTSEKLVEAFKLEIIYRPLKIFDIGSKKHTKTDVTDEILSGISIAFRQLKFDQHSWDPTLQSSDYLLEKPKEVIIFIKNKLIESISLLKEIENFLLAVEYLLLVNQTFINTVKLFINNLKNDLFLVEKYLDSLYLSSPYHFAFLCGLWDGIVEFVAGFLDIILLAFRFYFQLDELDAEDKITYLKVKEGVEEFIENYIKNPDFLKKSIGEAIGNYFEERYSENQNGYVISHNAGEDFIIGIDIIFSIVEVIKSIADVGKILPKMEHWVDDALKRNPNLESKLDDIHKPKELPEEPIREKAIEEVVVEPKKKPTPKERAEAKKQKIAKKLEEQKVLHTKTIDGNLPPSYEKGFNYYDARTPKPSEIPIHIRRQAKMLTHKVDKEVALLLDAEHSSGFSEGKKILRTKKGKKFIDKNWLRDRQLVAGVIHEDRKLGEIIKVKTNFPKSQLEKLLKLKGIGRGKCDLSDIKEIYKFYKQQRYLEYDMHPHIEQLLRTHFDEVSKGIKHPASYNWERTGGLPGTHAEVLALNDLLWTLESKGVKINDEVLKGFIGYNKNIVRQEYMIRCGDCQLILKDVVFLEKVTKFK
ncbi:MAG: hypothetical protein K0R77_1210 [Chryseobacterium sp.]|jgi:hypothetical protein|uniref:hypothetical protein n=1 Tax=Chryseobacterium sp. TaxID=1871047 RepID=UPI002618CD58|nr:hypothetical protein [Chryseobacterium sp.]MDF2551935.1 hypothetical protein [Chryseobacterium sp.]